MTISIAQNITTFLEDLKSADLIGISLLPQNFGLRLEFTFGPESGDAKIELYRIVHLVISQPLNTGDEDFCFWVGEVELNKIEENGSQILSALSYPFKDSKGSIETDSSLIYFRLEGDICVEVICGDYKIFQEI